MAIPDKNLRAAINDALGRNAMDSLDRSELLRLTSLSAVGLSISDLTGLEWAVNLQTADLRDNDITPVQELAQLTTLQIDGNPVAGGGPGDDIHRVPAYLFWAVVTMARCSHRSRR